MKSERFEILPRLRYIPSKNIWVCVWRDPGSMLQTKGYPLRYVHEYVGKADTSDDAIRNCHDIYLKTTVERDNAKRVVQRMFVPEHYIATSNLPWWRRLFRV